MSTINPIFRMQRTMLEQSQKIAESNLRFQRSAVHTMVGSLDATKSVQKSGLTLSKRTAEMYIDTLAETESNARAVEELRTAVDEQYAAVDEIHDDAWEAFSENVEEAVSAYDDLNEAQIDIVRETFETFLEAQTDAQAVTEDAVTSAEHVAESTADAAAEVAEEAAEQATQQA